MEKEKLIETMKNEMQIWRTKIDELKVQAKLGQSELQEILQPEVNNIEQELGKVEERVNQLQNASEGALDDIKHGADLALKAMQQSFEKASSHFKK
jgi:chromosome segregation ATPase